MSYSELDTASNTIGAGLVRRGAAPRLVIGLYLPRGADLLIAQAGIAKSGAAWLPFDAETPLERLQICLRSANAIGLVTCRKWLPRLRELDVPVWAVEDLLDENACVPLATAKSCDPAYVIYTSGSTGQPKGIAISQRSICHLLRAENDLLGVCACDRVYQGFSVAFDMSFEEIWLSYLVGATLWIAPPETVRSPEALAAAIAREHLTVLHAVPTLVNLLPRVPSTLRLLNLGGEACPEALVKKLERPGLKLFNSYGPTETTVSASFAELKAGTPVTIGTPLANYGFLVVDEERRPLPAHTSGELCIFGPGLANGYLGRPDLTADKFIVNPLAQCNGEERMYLTGDRGIIAEDGTIRCMGRIDNQVKIRGFRVEPDEITEVLSAQAGVAEAAVVMRAVGGMDQLVGFIVPENGAVSPVQLRAALAAKLPSYMVPARFETIAALPRLVSGKVDHKCLSSAPLKEAEPDEETYQASNVDEQALFAALKKLFPAISFHPDQDFFYDLGGHSLLAAHLVSMLREESRYAALSVQDVYQERRLGSIAGVMAHLRAHPQSTNRAERVAAPLRRRFFCGLAQSVVLPLFLLLHIADWLAPFFTYQFFTGDEGDSIGRAILYSLGVFIFARFAIFAIAIAGKRCLGRLRPGCYPIWGREYFRWWLSTKLCELPDSYLIAGTPWMPLFLRALGASVGRDTMIDAITFGAPELLTIEDGVSLGTFANLENARIDNGELMIGPIHLRTESVVDSYSVVEENTELEERAHLCGLSALSSGRRIPAGEMWGGSPARCLHETPEPLPPRPQSSIVRRALLSGLFAVTAIVVSVLFFLPVFPAFLLIDWVDASTLNVFESGLNAFEAFLFFFLLAIPAGAVFLGAIMIITAGMRFLLPKQAAGISSTDSFGYWCKRAKGLILDSSLRELHGIYASVFAPVWLRCLGCKVGRDAEISTAEGMIPDLLSIGDESFVADGVVLGDDELRGGWMVLSPTRIGQRSFLGNGAYVPGGTTVPDDVLIGVQTHAPRNAQLHSGQTWIGTPPILLPARESVRSFPESLTFHPSSLRRLGRGVVEGLRILLPLAFVIAAGYLITMLVMPLTQHRNWPLPLIGALAIAGISFSVGCFLFVVALKWIFVGRYHAVAVPMWTPFVWLSEAVTNLYESLAVPNLLDLLRGTPLLPWALRLLGARIGKGVFLNTTDLTEFDCVHIGDEAELNAWCGPQTHLFEDRVMKIGTVEIGSRVTVGARSTVLYDTNVGAGARLGPLTLVAKGEHLPANTHWEGCPAVPSVASKCFAAPLMKNAPAVPHCLNGGARKSALLLVRKKVSP